MCLHVQIFSWFVEWISWNTLCLTHISRASLFRDLGKQCRPRSDNTERGVWSESTLFAYRNFYTKQKKNWNGTPGPLQLEMESSNWWRWTGPLGKYELITVISYYRRNCTVSTHTPLDWLFRHNISICLGVKVTISVIWCWGDIQRELDLR